MLNEREFEFFRYCEGNWKIKRWTTKAYASWKRNHIKPNDVNDGNGTTEKKQKRELLDDPTLLQISDNNYDDGSSSNTTGSSTTSSSPEMTHTVPPLPSTPIVSQQRAGITFADPLDELYDEIANSRAAVSPKIDSQVPPTIDPTTSTAIALSTATTSSTGLTITAHDSLTTPMTSLSNHEDNRRRHLSTKRTKLVLAVVGKGLTEKNFCMKDWLEQNPGGSKDAFETYFNGLTLEAKKKYKDLAAVAQKARKGIKNGMNPPYVGMSHD